MGTRACAAICLHDAHAALPTLEGCTAKLPTSPKAENSSTRSSAEMVSGMPATKRVRPAGRSSSRLLCDFRNRCFENGAAAWMLTCSVLNSEEGATIYGLRQSGPAGAARWGAVQ